MDFKHPELKEGEIFLTNASNKQFSDADFRTKRLGNNAYDGNGKKLSHDDWFPVFISKKELSAIGKNLKTIRKSWQTAVESLVFSQSHP